jgi:hypothetical protein
MSSRVTDGAHGLWASKGSLVGAELTFAPTKTCNARNSGAFAFQRWWVLRPARNAGFNPSRERTDAYSSCRHYRCDYSDSSLDRACPNCEISNIGPVGTSVVFNRCDAHYEECGQSSKGGIRRSLTANNYLGATATKRGQSPRSDAYLTRVIG